MPLAIEQLDVSAYDVVISSSHAVAKGILTGPDQVHISYVHSPIRYAWDLQHQYLQQSKLTSGLKSAMARLILHYIRNWDIRTANSVDGFIANSEFIARRIREGLSARCASDLSARRRGCFHAVHGEGRLLSDRFAHGAVQEDRSDRRGIRAICLSASCVVIGDGPEMQKIRAKAGANRRDHGLSAVRGAPATG